MNKSDLMVALSKDTGLSVTKAAEVVNMFFGEMTDALVKGDRVEIRGIGSFKVKHYDGYSGRNPKTGELTKVKPKKLPFFKCGKELKERVDIHKSKSKGGEKVSDSDTVLGIIRRSKKGVNRAAVIKKTGFEGRKVGDILYRLKKHGKIKVEGKGIYVKA